MNNKSSWRKAEIAKGKVVDLATSRALDWHVVNSAGDTPIRYSSR